MTARNLTAKFCESVEPTPGRQVAYPDAGASGLELRVSSDGRRTWSFRYRTKTGRQGRITLGVFSNEFGLSRARREATKARVLVDEGGDPAEILREQRIRARTESVRTFDDLAESYFSATENGRYRPRGQAKRASSLRNERAVYKLHIKPELGKVRLEALSRALIKAMLGAMLDKGVTSQANKAQAILRQMLNYAVNELSRLPVNPLMGMPAVAPEKARSRVYTDAELQAIWAAIHNPSELAIPGDKAGRRRDGKKVFVGPQMRLLIQLAMLLLQRRNEIAGMAVAELDLEHGVWLIPEDRMKTRRAHAVPLSAYAIKLIEEAITLRPGGREANNFFVFESRAKPGRPINGPSVNNALGNVLLALGLENGTVHDLRRTGSTMMTSERLGVSPFIRSQVLGHSDNGGGSTVSAVHYDANSYMPEKRRALEAWEGLLLKIVDRPPAPSAADAAGIFG